MNKTGNKRPAVLATIFVLLCLALFLSTSILAPAVAHNPSELVAGTVDESTELPDLVITAIKPYHYGWSDKYGIAKCDPWFNLMNYVNVTVTNKGTAAAANFEVKLYADGEQIGSETVDELEVAGTKEVKFAWSLEGAGEDPLSWVDSADGAICTYEDTSKEYSLRAVIDEGDDIVEDDEDNNEFTKEQQVVWNGYMADEPLENYVHDEVEGGLLYTTGDGGYRCYDNGDSGTDDTYYTINYDLQIPGSTKLARLYFYYTWAKPSYKAPKIDAVLETPSGDIHNLNVEQSYNDIKGDFGANIYACGTYAYDITSYVQESGSYLLRVKNLNYGGGDSNFADKYSFASPAILVVYEDTTEPKREYWITEGADLLMGGGEESPYGGFLALEDCLNSAEFSGEHLDLEVEEAVLGVVSIWGGNPTTNWHSYLYFNGNDLGMDLYEGYYELYSEEMGGLSMNIGSDDAQIGIALTDVTGDLADDDNEVIQGDDGDNMMPANAFLMITYKQQDSFDTRPPENPYPSIAGIHNGTLEVTNDRIISTLYTYPCPGTGGHSEYVAFYNATTGQEIANGTWDGYQGDWNYIEFELPLVLWKNETYNYTIRTGSYPQIIHEHEFNATGGVITCTSFVDINGKRHEGWIPAIKLE